jgi:rhomboid family GlyGly-CTERM serine protease
MSLARIPWVTLAVSALAVAVYAAPGGTAAVELSRAGLGDGQLWRLATGHLAHWSFEHLLWDVATFAALGAACERASRRDTAVVLLLAAPTVALMVLAARPSLATYRGLSGLDVALFALLARQVGGRIGATLAAVLAAKLVYEAGAGAAVFVGHLSDAVVFVPAAHQGGALAAALWALAPLRARA